MKDLINKSAKLTIKDQVKNKILYYTAKEITSISDSHIFFIDKFNNTLGFRINDVIQVELISND